MAEAIGWILMAILGWWGIIAFLKAIPESEAKRKAEEEAYWRGQGFRD